MCKRPTENKTKKARVSDHGFAETQVKHDNGGLTIARQHEQPSDVPSPLTATGNCGKENNCQQY